MDESIDRIEYASMLYDFYGCLLNDKQCEVMALYHEDNLSLSEIADETGTSRQAVHYLLKKAESALIEYEEKLGLVAAYSRSRDLADEALAILAGDELTAESRARLRTLITSLAE